MHSNYDLWNWWELNPRPLA